MEKGGKTLSMFIVQPDGRESLKKINPTNRPGNIYVRGPLEHIVGVYRSTRGLRTTFDGSDPASMTSPRAMHKEETELR